ncbi:hypothetical protein QRD40_10725 [Comamonas sp. Y6]|uniref:Cytoplasmic protein n=1 Tax=Comamonas resistens TaxID=3046670 RepID=A0ABY8SXJ2_9BURK|nr:hypothetical protein [Comamonas resistens]MDL5036820.1 hypothetical protein [Comamonas resistens]WHS67130.1 hypothetical protein QMY55_08440 [Comamonas resistens]
MNNEELQRLERIEGQIEAIGMVLNALIAKHPEKQALLDVLQERSETMQVKLLSSHVPDAVLEGVEGFVRQWISSISK